jgi:hypothetical protein
MLPAAAVFSPPGCLAQHAAVSGGRRHRGQRLHDSAWIGIEPGGARYAGLLICRNIQTTELAFYGCYAPCRVTVATLVKGLLRRRGTATRQSPASAPHCGADRITVGAIAGKPG